MIKFYGGVWGGKRNVIKFWWWSRGITIWPWWRFALSECSDCLLISGGEGASQDSWLSKLWNWAVWRYELPCRRSALSECSCFLVKIFMHLQIVKPLTSLLLNTLLQLFVTLVKTSLAHWKWCPWISTISKGKDACLKSRHPWLFFRFYISPCKVSTNVVCNYWSNVGFVHQVPLASGWTEAVWNMKFIQHFYTWPALRIKPIPYPLACSFVKILLLTLTVLVTTIDVQWEGMGDVGSARYELALLPPCLTIRVLSYSN